MIRHITHDDIPHQFGFTLDELIATMTNDAQAHIHDDEVSSFVIEG